ncbi:MAG: alpha/beta hydrolase [Treponemataceae bacterium]|nr:alpha/beta hydrolase [Treponemataceae bacterium]
MKKIPAKNLVLFCLFCLAFFSGAGFTLFVIDANVSGWISLFILLGLFVFFRFSSFWEKYLSGKLGWFKKLWIFVLIVLALDANCKLSRPDRKVSYMGTLVREFIREARNLPMMKGDGMLSAGAALSAKGSEWKAPKGYTNTKIDCGVPIELLKKDGSDSKKLIFQIHGGAYVIGMIDSYRNQAVKLSKLADDAAVINIDYRIAPEYVYPAALEDGMAAWNWILENGWKASDVTLIGDSAGGNLVLALCLKLRDQGRELPEKIICLSPWGDLAGTGETHRTNLYKDPMFGIARHSCREADKVQSAPSEPAASKTESGTTGTTEKKSMTSLYAGSANLFDPYLSPVFGDYKDFPPMLIQVGTWEVLQSDSRTIYQNAKAQGVDATLQEYEGMYHVFQQVGDLIPESKEAWKEIGLFLKR